MTRKQIIFLIAALAAIAAIVIALFCAKRRAPTPQEQEEAQYDRMTDPEYQKMLEFEKAAQQRTMGEIARARQNLDEAKQAQLEPEIIKELEDEVAAHERELELERERMRANLQREIWKETHPEQVRAVDDYRAKEREIMAEIDAAQKRLDEAVTAGADGEQTAALKAALDALVAKLEENHRAASRTLRNFKNK